MVRLVIPLLFSVLLLLVPCRVTAQVSGGTVSGSITDSSAAPLLNVRVSLTDLQTRLTRTVTTDAQGFYTVPNLPPDTYEMSASAPGFVTQVRTGSP